MVGRDLGDLYQRAAGPPAMCGSQVRDLVVPPGGQPGRRLVDGLSFEVHGGEVVALAGLLGSGRTESLLAIFGALPRDGEVAVDGKALAAGSIDGAIDARVALVTEDRKETGLDPRLRGSHEHRSRQPRHDRTDGILNRRGERELAERLAGELALRPPRIERPARAFSGGNQQKIVLAKWLARQPERPAPRRADARRGRRREGGDLRHHRPAQAPAPRS